MQQLSLVLSLILLSNSSFAADPQPAPIPPVHWPVLPAPMPNPPPTPNEVTSLASDQIYVLGIDADSQVLASPAGIVQVIHESGPVKIRGRFVDGNGNRETRKYTNKQVVCVEPVGTGKVELMVVYGGAGSAAQIERRTINVGGNGPTPPSPPNPPTPTPDDFTKSVQAAFAAETDAAKASQVALLASIYRLGSGLVQSDVTLATTSDLLDRMQISRKAVLPDTAILKVRQAIQAELNKTLSQPETLDATTRATVGALLAKVATILESLKGS